MISPFEYITVLISILLGMGLTYLVSGFAAIIIHWDRVKIYWPHLIMIVLVFIIHIQDWWATYELHKVQYWRLPTFLFIILYPVVLYLLARVLFPVRWSGKEIDLKAFYSSSSRKIYFLMTLLPVISIIDNIGLGGYKIEQQGLQFFVFIVFASVSFSKQQPEWVHKALAIMLAIVTIVTFVVAWNVFLISNY